MTEFELNPLEEIVLKKFEIANEVLAKHTKIEADPPDLPKGPDLDKGSERCEDMWAQGWPGGCSI